MKCTHPGCSYESTHANPIVARRNLAIHMAKTHGDVGKAQRAHVARQKRAGEAIAESVRARHPEPPRPFYRTALENAAAAGEELGQSATSTGEVVAGLVLFLQALGPARAEVALDVLGWQKRRKQ